MDPDDPIEARNQRLADLQHSDPVAWAICQGKRGAGTISKLLNMPQEQVEKELKRLRKAGEVKAVRYGRGWNHRPHSIELKRLARRAWKLNKEENN